MNISVWCMHWQWEKKWGGGISRSSFLLQREILYEIPELFKGLVFYNMVFNFLLYLVAIHPKVIVIYLA